MTNRVLIADDDPVQRRLLKAAVERIGLVPEMAQDGEVAVALLGGGAEPVDAVILDLMMPGMDGIAVLDWMGKHAPDIPVIVQTGQGGIETVVKAMRAGAFDFVVKPVSPERLAQSIGNALKTRGAVSKADSKALDGFGDIVAASPAMDRVLMLARRAATSNIPVVLEGESGVGKEMIARAIQTESQRRTKSFITVNCGAIPDSLVESILFGHEKGAFTGAVERHTGKFVEADKGTLFLDEIGDLPLDVQVKLLRAVQTGEIETVGARQVHKVDIRLISATNKDLIEEVKAGRFREDLYYRLNVFPIHVPALRNRKEDIPELVRHFVRRYAHLSNRPGGVAIDAATLALLTAHDWPGNIRELENAVHRAVVLCDSGSLTVELFPQIAAQMPDYVLDPGSGQTGSGIEEFLSAEPQSGFGVGSGTIEAEEVSKSPEHNPLIEMANAMAARSPNNQADRFRTDAVSVADHPVDQGNALQAVAPDGEIRPLSEIEEELIRFALSFYKGQMSEVARRLGIGRSTLYRKLKDYAIDPDDPRRVAA